LLFKNYLFISKINRGYIPAQHQQQHMHYGQPTVQSYNNIQSQFQHQGQFHGSTGFSQGFNQNFQAQYNIPPPIGTIHRTIGDD
jgi:hypothetical protein